MKQPYGVGIVGAGGISEIHGRILREYEGARIVAVVDRDFDKAALLARETRADRVFRDVEELVQANVVEAAHVLVPPSAHVAVAKPLLEAGIHVLCEKPLAPSVAECQALVAASESGRAQLAVNLNMLFDRTQRALKDVLTSGRLGPVRHLIAVWNVPLGPLAARRFGEWMFQRPGNVVIDQGVHPVSLLFDLAGKPTSLQCLPSPARRLTDAVSFVDTWQVSLRFEECTAQLLLNFGQPMQVVSMRAICDDGVANADYVHGRVVLEQRGKWELAASFADGMGQAGALLRQSVASLFDTGLKPLGLRPDPDPFFNSMKGSIEAFYAGIGSGRQISDGRFGTDVVAACEELARSVETTAPRGASRPRAQGHPEPEELAPCDVAILAGTGVIGRRLVAKLVEGGRTVRVMARTTRGLSGPYLHEDVQVLCGNAESADDVRRLVSGATRAVDLYYPSQGDDVDKRMVASAERFAAACTEAGVKRLVYTSSTAALYLGDPNEVITGRTPPDPLPEERPAYSRGKGASERRLQALHRDTRLPVCILRPGIVVGEGGVALHPGMGRFVNPQHCIGWNHGKNPMAFVLVDDVARAIVAALFAEGVDGRTYNVVGGVPMSAREYLEELGRAWGRPLRYHPLSLWRFQGAELAKWAAKRVAGRRDARVPSLRDSKSRAMVARFDLSDIEHDLGWSPVRDREEFVRQAIGVHARQGLPEVGADEPSGTSGSDGLRMSG